MRLVQLSSVFYWQRNKTQVIGGRPIESMCHLPTQVQGCVYCHHCNSCLGDVSGLSRFHGVTGFLPQTHSPSCPKASCPIAINKRVPHLSHTCPNPWYSSRLSSDSFSPIEPSLLQLSFTISPSFNSNSIGICISGTHPFWHWGLVSWRIIFSTGLVWGIVSEWLKHVRFIVRFISIIITSAPPRIIRH